MLTSQVAVIAAGASVSTAVNLFDGNLVGIQMPAAWTAAGIQLEGSFDGLSFFPLHDVSGNALGIASPGINLQYALDPVNFLGVRFVRIRSGTSAAPVIQVSSATLNLLSRRFL